MEWHRAQLVFANALPRCSLGEAAIADVVMKVTMTIWRKEKEHVHMTSKPLMDGVSRRILLNIERKAVRC
jgi:hypothetical protein